MCQLKEVQIDSKESNSEHHQQRSKKKILDIRAESCYKKYLHAGNKTTITEFVVKTMYCLHALTQLFKTFHKGRCHILYFTNGEIQVPR